MCGYPGDRTDSHRQTKSRPPHFLSLYLSFDKIAPFMVLGIKTNLSTLMGMFPVARILTSIVAVVLLQHRSCIIDLTFTALLSLLKFPQIFYFRDFRLYNQALLGQRSRATRTILSLVTRKVDLEHAILKSPGSCETCLVV